MKRIAIAMLAFVLALAPSSAAEAGLDEGKAAFLAADYETASAELRPLAQAGNAEAQYVLGVMYSHGRGVGRDLAESARWYEKAAQQGHARAQFNLGFMLYNDGRYAAAAPWLLKAAEQGVAMAQGLVGAMYADGKGVAKDPLRAYWWTLRAAEQGVAGAQYDAGMMCVARLADNRCSPIEAYKWFRLLADKGYPGAAENAERLAQAMTAAQIDDAESLAEAWRPLS